MVQDKCFFSDNNGQQQVSESHFIDTNKTNDNVTVDVCTIKGNVITC